jgi:hypothetical protein
VSKRERKLARRLAEIRAVLDERSTGVYSVLSITFDNVSVEIPYLPWQPRNRVTLPGRWERDTEPELGSSFVDGDL